MPIFLFKGRILPELSDLSLWPAPTVHYSEPPHLPDLPDGLTSDFTIAINNSLIDLICNVEQESASIPRVHNRAIAYVRALVDLHSYATGAALSVILDTVIGPDGVAQSLRNVNPQLAGICTVTIQNPQSLGTLGFGNVLDSVIQEPALFLALRDLISAITYSGDLAVIDCARSVEGLRSVMAPGVERKEAWGVFQKSLNIDRAYREYITNLSKGPRHGDRIPMDHRRSG